MHGPGFGGMGFGGGPGFGGPHGGFGFGPGPMHFGFFPHRHYGSSLLGVGLTAFLGSMLGNSVANKNNYNNSYANSNNYNNNTNNNSKVYELFNYCPSCGKERVGSSSYCSNCGASLIR